MTVFGWVFGLLIAAQAFAYPRAYIIEKNGIRSCLFGTMHLDFSLEQSLGPEVKRCLELSERMLLERADYNDPYHVYYNDLNYSRNNEALVGPDLWKTFISSYQYVMKRKIDFVHMQPESLVILAQYIESWTVSEFEKRTLKTPKPADDRTFDEKYLDGKLRIYARKHNKKLIGLDDATGYGSELPFFLGLVTDEDVKAVFELLFIPRHEMWARSNRINLSQAQKDQRNALWDRIMSLYLNHGAAENIKAIEKKIFAMSTTVDEWRLPIKQMAQINQRLTQRHEDWIDIIDRVASSKPSFIAVGRSHVDVEVSEHKSLVTLLREKGFSVRLINPCEQLL